MGVVTAEPSHRLGSGPPAVVAGDTLAKLVGEGATKRSDVRTPRRVGVGLVKTGGMPADTLLRGGSLEGVAIKDAWAAADVASDGLEETSGRVASTGWSRGV